MTPLRRLALFYFFSYGAGGALLPMLPVLLASRELDATEISWVMALNPALALVIPPLWGIIADAFHARIALIRTVAFGSAITVLLFLPSGGALFSMIAMAIFCFFRTPISSLMDAATYAALGPAREGFARVRLWGSVGFGLCVFLAGTIDVTQRPTALLLIVAALYLISGLISLTLTAAPITRERAVFSRALSFIISSGLGLLFIASGFYYVAQSTFDIYFALHVKQLELSSSVMGWGWAAAVFSEVGLMAIAPQIIASRRSWTLLVFSSAVAAIRWLLTSLIVWPPALIAVQALHGITFGLWYLSLVTYIQERVPEELRTSVQGVSNAAIAGGSIAGALGGGLFLEYGGGAGLFQTAAAAAALSGGMYYYLSKRKGA